METQTLLTAKDIQRIFSCGKNKAYKIMSLKGFPTITVGGKMYVRPQSLERWLAQNEEYCVVL